MSKIEELLNILNLSEEEQYKFLFNYFIKIYFKTDEWPYWYGICDILIHGDSSERETTLAELAFVLRDKGRSPFGVCAWDRACWEVWRYVETQQGSDIFKRKHLSLETREKYCSDWMMLWAEPIHWIIVALITKEIVADSEEKFDAHLTEEDEVQCETCRGSGIKPFTKFYWCIHCNEDVSEDHLITLDRNESKDRCPICRNRVVEKTTCPNCSNDDEKRSLAYVIAQSDDKGGFDFWDGPNPSKEGMLAIDGRDDNSVIMRFNADGTNEIIYRWGGDVWIEVGGGGK